MKRVKLIFWGFVRWWKTGSLKVTIHRGKWNPWIYDGYYVCHTCCIIWKDKLGPLPTYHWMHQGYEQTDNRDCVFKCGEH